MRDTTGRYTRRAMAFAVGAFALGALAGCGSSTASDGPARMSVLLTDAPGDVKAAVVTISEIDLQGSGGSTVLMSTPVTTDLLTLAGNTAQLVNGVVVPAGRYAQLRFVITGGYVEVQNGDGSTSIYASSPDYEGLPDGAQVSGALQMPSFAQSGLKVNLPAGIATLSSGQHIVLVDFNVAQSFGHAAGASGQWVMHPVVKATDFETTGGLTVTLAADPSLTMPVVNGSPLTLGDFNAVLTASDGSTEQVAFTDDGTGAFTAHFPFVAPGSYSLDLTTLTGVAFATSPDHPATVTIASGQDATSAFTLTAVSLTP